MKVIKGDKVVYSFTHEMDHVEIIKPKETIIVETNDCFFQQIENEDISITELDYDVLNPATGPIYVETAEPGDLLKVRIISIDIEDKGVTVTIPKEGVLGDQAKESKIKIIPIENNHAIFNGIRIPVDPMIGVIGVAPKKEDGQWPTATPWKHGGNMDTKVIKAGSTLYFPVHQNGALLALGDCHALMGDGEVCFAGLEIPGKVTLEVDVIKNKSIEWPIVETEDANMIIASGDDLDDAIYKGTSEAVKYLQNGLNIGWEDAYILSSLVMDLQISQVVDPKKTIRASIAKSILSTEDLINSL